MYQAILGTKLILDYVITIVDYVCIPVENNIQGVPGGKDLTSGECSLGQTIPI